MLAGHNPDYAHSERFVLCRSIMEPRGTTVSPGLPPPPRGGGRKIEGLGARKPPKPSIFPERGTVPLALTSPSPPLAKSEVWP